MDVGKVMPEDASFRPEPIVDDDGDAVEDDAEEVEDDGGTLTADDREDPPAVNANRPPVAVELDVDEEAVVSESALIGANVTSFEGVSDLDVDNEMLELLPTTILPPLVAAAALSVLRVRPSPTPPILLPPPLLLLMLEAGATEATVNAGFAVPAAAALVCSCASSLARCFL